MTSWRFFSRMRFFEGRYVWLVVFGLIALVGVSFGREVVRTRDIERQIHSLEAQAQELRTKNLTISELRDAVQTESFIEREARLKLGLKKPGEAVVVVKGEQRKTEVNKGEQKVKSETDPLGIVIPEMKETQELANSVKWWYYFFDKNQLNRSYDEQR